MTCARCHKPLCECSDWEWRNGTLPARYSARVRVDQLTSAFRQVGFDIPHAGSTKA